VTSRIEHEQSELPPSTLGRPSLFMRAGALLSSPTGILLAVPGLSALLGLLLTALAADALRGSNLSVARARLREQAALVEKNVSTAVANCEPLMDRLVELTQARPAHAPLDPYAHALADVMRARPGIAYVSASFPDGTFLGAYRDEGGQLMFQESVIVDASTRVRRYRFVLGAPLALQVEEQSQYDPRKRPFYERALKVGARTWTEPYPFYKTHVTGITRTEPVYADVHGKRTLHAVLTIDFDFDALSLHMREHNVEGVRAVLFTQQGVVLASTAWQGDHATKAPVADRTLTFADLDDPLAQSFASLLKGQKELKEVGTFTVGEEPYLAVVEPVSSPAQLGWAIAYVAPESLFLKDLHSYERKSLLLALCAVALSMGVGVLFARHVTRARREIASAKSDAARARSKARELGSYRLMERLGKGGMGEVWRAEHQLLAREAAIKLISPNLLGDDSDDLKQRFKLEAEALASLRSRHTIELFDYGVAADGTFFFVMELLDGVDLETLVVRHGKQPAARVVPLLIQACASLAEAHDRGMIHRDVKPANLFVCRAADEVDVVKVLDFGLVRAAQQGAEPIAATSLTPHAEPPQAESSPRITQMGSAMGTPGFMAPEQAMAMELDGRADVYALGGVAFWLLSGQLVFEDSEVTALLIATISQPADLSHLPPSVPLALRDIVQRCLAKDPADRPASARDLAEQLRAIDFSRDTSWSPGQAQAFWREHLPLRPKKSSSPAREVVESAHTVLFDASGVAPTAEALPHQRVG
jgi:serine/threonine protein kinase